MPFCIKCGKENEDDARFCQNCGYAVDKTVAAAISATAETTAFLKSENDFTVSQVDFYKKTYLTAGFSFMAWIFLVFIFFETGIAEKILYSMGAVNWLVVLGIFWVASFISEKLIFAEEKAAQYVGLGIYIINYAVIFIPLLSLVIVESYGSLRLALDNILIPAFISTLTVFAALTVTVFATRTDFSFLKTFMIFGTFIAFGAIIILSVSETQVGSWFAIAMIILMSITILYQTSQIKDKFQTNQYIGAGAMLFASFMVLLWYIIKLFLTHKGRK